MHSVSDMMNKETKKDTGRGGTLKFVFKPDFVMPCTYLHFASLQGKAYLPKQF